MSLLLAFWSVLNSLSVHLAFTLLVVLLIFFTLGITGSPSSPPPHSLSDDGKWLAVPMLGSCLLNLSCHKILIIEAGCFLTCPQHILFIYEKNRSHDFDVLLSHKILVSAQEALWDPQRCQGELTQQQHIPLHPALSSPLLFSIELWDLWFTEGSFLSCFLLVALPKSL